MVEEMIPDPNTELSSDDKLWAALAWLPVTPLWPVIAIVTLFMEDKKDQPFIRYNAVLSIVVGLFLIPASIITCGVGAFGYLVFFWWAYQAYQGQEITLPFFSDWIREQGWA